MELVVQPPTRYAWLGQDRIAYGVLGEGPVDLVFTPGSFGNIDMVREDPGPRCSCEGWRRSAG